MKKPDRSVVIAGAVAVLVIVAAVTWWRSREPAAQDLILYGNVDVRQVSLAFNGSERVAEMRVNEGDLVQPGQVLAVLETTTLKLQIAQAQAQTAAQAQALRRLKSGNRPEEVAQARANVVAALADTDKVARQFERLQAISQGTGGRAVSQQELDAGRANYDVAQAQLERARQSLDLAVAGARVEDIDQAEAQLKAAQAELSLMQHQLTQAELKAPVAAVVRSRLLEPGDMASPQRPAYSLAITHPKWVRAYISEVDLGHVRPGQPASVVTDSDPRPLPGRVGFIASTAEFTPKTVQTEELRTSLVYEIRVNVDDPDNRLRLGMPATIHLSRAIAASTTEPPL